MIDYVIICSLISVRHVLLPILPFDSYESKFIFWREDAEAREAGPWLEEGQKSKS